MSGVKFIRHAQSHGNIERIIQGQSDSGLSAQGWLDACTNTQISTSLGSSRLVVAASSLRRARDTARVIARRCCAQSLIIDPLLDEVCAGVLEGLRHSDAELLMPDLYTHWKNRSDLNAVPWAETGQSVQHRAVAALARYRDTGASVLLVGHAASGRVLLNAARAISRNSRIEIPNLSVHEVAMGWERRGPRVHIFRLPECMLVVKCISSARSTWYRALWMHGQNQTLPGVFPSVRLVSERPSESTSCAVVMDGVQGCHRLTRSDSLRVAMWLCSLVKMHWATDLIRSARTLSAVVNKYVSDEVLKVANLTPLLRAHVLQATQSHENAGIIYYDVHPGNFLWKEDRPIGVDLCSLVRGTGYQQAGCFVAGAMYSWNLCADDALRCAARAFALDKEQLRQSTLVGIARALIGVGWRMRACNSKIATRADHDDLLDRYLHVARALVSSIGVDLSHYTALPPSFGAECTRVP